MTKTYRFDYIKEIVEQWRPWIPKTYENINFLPFYVSTPWIMPDCYIPPKDYYGEVVEDIGEWYEQRCEYIKNLVKEYEERDIQTNNQLP